MYYLADFSFLRDLAKEALKKRHIPPVPLIRKGLGNSLLTAVKNPLKISESFKDGMVVDKVANSLAKRMGKTRLGLTGEAGKKIITSKPAKELVVNSAGALLSTTPLGVAGDLMGAIGARRIIDDSYATARAFNRSRRLSPNLGLRGRVTDTLRRSRKINKAMTRLNENPHIGDTVGWGIGNAAAETIPFGVPLKGAAVAMTTGDIVEKGVKDTIKGNPVTRTLRTVGTNLKNRFNLRKQIRDGFDREEQMRRRLNRKLGASLIAPNSNSFSSPLITVNF